MQIIINYEVILFKRPKVNKQTKKLYVCIYVCTDTNVPTFYIYIFDFEINFKWHDNKLN